MCVCVCVCGTCSCVQVAMGVLHAGLRSVNFIVHTQAVKTHRRILKVDIKKTKMFYQDLVSQGVRGEREERPGIRTASVPFQSRANKWCRSPKSGFKGKIVRSVYASF